MKKMVKRLSIIVLAAAFILSFTISCKNVQKPGSDNNAQEKTGQSVESTNNYTQNGTDNGTTQNTSTQNDTVSDQTQQPSSNGDTQSRNSTDNNELPKDPKYNHPVKVRAIYLTGWSAGNTAKIQSIIDLAKTTELNSVVIDIKDDDGMVGYESNIKEVREMGAWEMKYDVGKVLKMLHDNNIHVIGRLVCFKDPILSSKRPDLSYKTRDGKIWKDNKGRSWVNPMNKEAWDYNIKIAREAVDKGFDEIQYDYVRFSNDGNIKSIDFGPNFDPNTKSDIIAEFLRRSMKEIHDGKGVFLSADLFAIAAVSTADDKTLGQNWEKLCKEADYVCPMSYPSHYANAGQNGVGQEINKVLFKKPDLEPYNVVYQTLLSAKARLDKVEHKAKVRPYLQAFNAPWLKAGYWQKYGAVQVRQQIKAVYDAGYEEWILWDPNNRYSDDYFLKKEQ